MWNAKPFFWNWCPQFPTKHRSYPPTTRGSWSSSDLTHDCKSASFPQSPSKLFSAACTGGLGLNPKPFPSPSASQVATMKDVLLQRAEAWALRGELCWWPETPRHGGRPKTQRKKMNGEGKKSSCFPGPGCFTLIRLVADFPKPVSLLFIWASFPFPVPR